MPLFVNVGTNFATGYCAFNGNAKRDADGDRLTAAASSECSNEKQTP